MPAQPLQGEFPKEQRPLGPFRRAVLRGLAILLPPLLTIVIFLWVGNTIKNYLLVPLENSARWVMVEMADIRTPDNPPDPGEQLSVGDQVMIDGNAYTLQSGRILRIDGEEYQLTPDDRFIPREVYRHVQRGPGRGAMPSNAEDIYRAYINDRWLSREFVVPVFLCLFVLVLYLLGKFLAAGMGRFFWGQMEGFIHRVPLVRNVYSSVKQVTDFMFKEPEVQYSRVVAVEYPRKGIWTTAFVTGDSMEDIRSAAKEPVLSVLIPTSPMPFTGFTVSVRKSEVVDLNISVEQAFQFIVSCGVVVPPQQLVAAVGKEEGAAQPALALASSVEDND